MRKRVWAPKPVSFSSEKGGPVILSEASVELDSRRRMGYYLFQTHPARILESIRLLLTQLRLNTLDATCHFKTAPMITFKLEFNWSSTISLSVCVCVCVSHTVIFPQEMHDAATAIIDPRTELHSLFFISKTYY